jgi:hypothetical protein
MNLTASSVEQYMLIFEFYNRIASFSAWGMSAENSKMRKTHILTDFICIHRTLVIIICCLHLRLSSDDIFL